MELRSITKLRKSFVFLSRKASSEAGQISTSVIVWIGISVIALTAVAWIGNTTAGSGGNTAECIANFKQDRGKYAETDPCWTSDDHAVTADQTRENNFGITGGDGAFGASTVPGDRLTVVNTSKVKQALQRMIQKESGSMNQIYTNSRPILMNSTCTTTTNNVTFYNSCYRTINQVIDQAWIHERINSSRAGDFASVADQLEAISSPHAAEARALANRYQAATTAAHTLNQENDVAWRSYSSRSVAENRALLTSHVNRLQAIQNEWISINNAAKALQAKI